MLSALPTLLQGGENAADLAVEVRDHPVILGQLIANDVLGSRPGRQVLVPAPVHHAVIERMLRQEIGGQRETLS